VQTARYAAMAEGFVLEGDVNIPGRADVGRPYVL
jgi:hypothetical protein